MKKWIALLLTGLMLFGMAAMFCGCEQPEEKAKVYYLNPNPEADTIWQALAAQYTEDTGVEVKVVTAASGSYQELLTKELRQEAPPTLFQCDNDVQLAQWNDYCLDFTGTEVLKEMTTDAFNLTDSTGAVKAIGFCYEAFGIIVNKALLEQAGYQIEDITDFTSMKTVAEDIHSRGEELGFDAFAPMGTDTGYSRSFSGALSEVPAGYRLANLPLYYEFRDRKIREQSADLEGTYLDAYRNALDLYLNNCAPVHEDLLPDESKLETNLFAQGKAVFWHQGLWSYKNLTDSMDGDDLQMIPIYCGVEGEENAALCCDTESRWAVNAKARPMDVQATLEFLKWVVTADVSTNMMAQQFGPIPFKAAKAAENVFFDDANRLLAQGNYVVTWDLRYAPQAQQWKAGVHAALTDYMAGNGQWSAVETAFVDGWAIQYEKQD